MLTRFRTLAKNRDGVTAIEYGLIAGLVALAIITALTTLGGNLSTAFTNIGSHVTAAAT